MNQGNRKFLALGHRMRLGGRVVVLGALTALAGCGESYTLTDDGTDPTASYYDPLIKQGVDAQLAQASTDAARSLERLNTVMQARTPTPEPAEVPDASVPVELKQLVSEVSWSGPAIALVQDMAQKAGYQFVPPEHDHNVPVMATIDVHNVTILSVLQDVGNQVGMYATIVTNPASKTITFRYNDEDMAPLQATGPGAGRMVHGRHHRGSGHERPPAHGRTTNSQGGPGSAGGPPAMGGQGGGRPNGPPPGGRPSGPPPGGQDGQVSQSESE